MPEFLQLLPLQDALDLWCGAFPGLERKSEIIETAQALDRITAVDVVAQEPLPAFSRSTVDGYAVRASETFGAGESLPAYFNQVGEVPMGGKPSFSLGRGECALIHTGGMLPDNADAVVMLEYTQLARPGEIEVMRACAPFENMICAGEDVKTGQVVLPAGTRLRPAEIGGLMALGIQRISVETQKRIAVFSSGDEIVAPDVTPAAGQVRDINSYTLSAMIKQWGGKPVSYGIVPDNADSLSMTLSAALRDCDAVVVTAGSSASSRDVTAQVIQNAGQPGVLVHGLSVRPGKPTILGVCSGKPVLGLPGNPVSALVIAWLVFPTLFSFLNGLPKVPERDYQMAQLTINVASRAGCEEWVPVHLSSENGQLEATPVFYKSNLIFNLSGADGLMHIPADANGISAGEPVFIYQL